MTVYYDDGECGRLIGELPPTTSCGKVQCVSFSEIANLVIDYYSKNYIENFNYDHVLIVTK